MLAASPEVSLLLLLALSVAAPDPAQVEWVWEGPEVCRAGPAAQRRFAELAPESCQRAQSEPLRVTAVAARAGGRWTVLLTLRRGALVATRSLTAGSCATLAEASAVIAATACPGVSEVDGSRPVLDAGATASPGELAPEAEPAGSPLAPEVVVVPAAARVEPVFVAEPDEREKPPWRLTRPRRRSPGLTLGARLAAAWGATPAPALLAGVAVQVRWPAVALLFAVDGGPRRRVGGRSGPGIDIRLATATIAACPLVPFGAGRRRGYVALCLGVEAGAMFGTGVGTPITRTAAQPWVAGLVGPSVIWTPHRRVHLGVAVDVAVGATRPAFVLDGYPFSFRAAATAVRFRIVLSFRVR